MGRAMRSTAHPLSEITSNGNQAYGESSAEALTGNKYIGLDARPLIRPEDPGSPKPRLNLINDHQRSGFIASLPNRF